MPGVAPTLLLLLVMLLCRCAIGAELRSAAIGVALLVVTVDELLLPRMSAAPRPLLSSIDISDLADEVAGADESGGAECCRGAAVRIGAIEGRMGC